MPVPRTPRRRLTLATGAAALATAALAGLAAAAPAAPAPPAAAERAEPGGSSGLSGSAGYYDAAHGKTGAELKAALHTIVSDQTTLTYSQVWAALRVTDEDPANPANVVLLYSGRSQSEYDNGGDRDEWNREHVWAKSHGGFGTVPGPGTDVHHLRPTAVPVNGIRGNKDFDHGGAPVAGAPGNLTDADSFEPRDAVKGDVARMLFYMAVRYEGGDGFADLELNDSTANGSSPYQGRLSVLRQWHDQDPPDAFEKRRNDLIHQRFQHNRNPFVDHPEWVAHIWP
ncbi:endonuclease [Streptomyces sp. TRM70308]|uniref:endonuclease I family protein n=1 Tax=Streptomyces sp. TRM70308 TaxID=3131932 RepID=UPI003D0323B3